MSTSDKFPRHFVSSCECDNGELVVDMTEPDYPFADLTKRNYYPRYECEKCKAKYRLDARGNQITVHLREDGTVVRVFAAD